MKKTPIMITALVLMLCIGLVWYSFFMADYDYKTSITLPTTVWFEKDTLILGTIPYNSEREAVFRFMNTGINPLLIRDVRPSCGCTSVQWEKRPVSPGAFGEIKIYFKPNSLGIFLKNIEVMCNVPSHSINLKLRGSVIE